MQNLLTPWKFKQFNLSKNFIIRNDVILDVDSSFELDHVRIFKKLFYIFNESIVKLERPQNMQLRTLYGIAPSVPYAKSCSMILDGIVLDMMNVIFHLTQHLHPVHIVEHVRCDVKELPKFTLDLIQFLNSHKHAIEFVGTDASIVTFDKFNLKCIHKDNTEAENMSVKQFPMCLQKLNMAFKLLGIPVQTTNVNELFTKHDCILNAYVSDRIDSSKSPFINEVVLGRGSSEYDAQVALLLKTNYKFSDSRDRKSVV